MPFAIDQQIRDLHQSPITSIEVKQRSDDAELVFTCSEEELLVTDLGSRKTQCLYKCSDPSKEELNALKLFPSTCERARHLFASNAQHLCLFELEKLKMVTKLKFNKDTISCLELNTAGTCLACGDDSGEIKLLDLRVPSAGGGASIAQPSVTLNRNLNAHTNICYALRFNPANEYELFSAGFDCSIIKWDMRSAKKAAKQHAFVKQINVSEVLTSITKSETSSSSSDAFVSSMTPCFVHCLEFCDSHLLMAGVESGMCMLFDAQTCEYAAHRQLQPFNCALTQLCRVQMDGESACVAAAGNGTDIEFVSLKTSQAEAEAETETRSFQIEDTPSLQLKHQNKVNCLRYSSSSKKLFVGDTTNGLTIYKYLCDNEIGHQ